MMQGFDNDSETTEHAIPAEYQTCETISSSQPSTVASDKHESIVGLQPRSYTPLMPKPKRVTVAGQEEQHRKLTKPFRCPVVFKPANNPFTRSMAHSIPTQAEALVCGKLDKGFASPPRPPVEDRKIRHRTQRAAAQFKSPLTIAPSSQQTLIRPTPTIQALERRVQTLKRALRVVRDDEEETLEKVTAKWLDAGREVAYELWTLVRDSARGGDESWATAGLGSRKRKVEEGWGWDDGSGRNMGQSGNGSSWGWDETLRDLNDDETKRANDDEHDASTDAHFSEGLEDQEVTRATLGTMLLQLGICPSTLGWDEGEECFVD